MPFYEDRGECGMADIDEIDAMKRMSELMEKLDEGARTRSLDWLVSKYGMGGPKSARAAATPNTQPTQNEPYASFAELFDAAQPVGDRDRALVAAYWAQVCAGAENFQSQTLNDELKNLGYGVSNITDALTRLKSDRPALILQLKKSGTAKQARKTYKMTQEGIRRVGAMVASNSGSQDFA